MCSLDKDKMRRYLNDDNGDRYDTYPISQLGGQQSKLETDLFVKNDWDAFRVTDETKDLSGVLAKVHQQINRWNYQRKRSVKYQLYRYYSAVAAILLLPLAIFSVLHFTGTTKENDWFVADMTISAPEKSRVLYYLPDSSLVHIAGGSQITVSTNYLSNRLIQLTGQAHFEVVSDKMHPFVVEMAAGQVEVLGTRFTAESDHENHMKVVLEEGKVKATITSNNETFILKPNQQLELVGGKSELSTIDALAYTAWKEGKLIFKDDALPDVIKRIEEWYGVKITMDDARLKKYSFRGVFIDETVEEVLRMMAFSLPIDYKVTERKMLANGTYTKCHITITKR